MNAAAYARYSTDHQTENSIEYQLKEIRQYCREHDITITATFTDEAESGTNTDRPGFQQLMEAARRREFDAVVIYDISRGSRDVGDWFTFRKAMMVLGVNVISATQRLGDLENGQDFLLELLTVGMGHAEVLGTRQKSIDGVAVKAREGKFLGGVAPLGYDIVNGAYVVNQEEARAVRTIFSMYADGKSYSAILEAVKGTTGKRGQPLGKNSLHSILKNERYIGTYTWNKRKVKRFRKWAGGVPNPACVRLEGIIPAIIDNDTWDRVQKRMNDNKRNASNKAVHTYLLSGLIECESCGATFVGHTSRNAKGYENRRYICGNKYRTRTCDAKTINADEIEVFVVSNLKEYLLQTDFQEEAQRIADAVNSATADLREERAELAAINAKIQNGLRAILNGFDDLPELRVEMDRLRVRKSELEDIIGRRTSSARKVCPEDVVKIFDHAVEDWDHDLPRIIKQHITKIYAHADGSYSVNVGVHINGCGRGI